MKLALLSDIHANISALEAAYAAVNEHAPEEIIHLGDLCGYAPFNDEVVDFMKAHKIRGVRGNYDNNVAINAAHCGCRYDDPEVARMAQTSFDWTKQHVSDESREYLRGLPFSIELETGGKKVKLFHATPNKDNVYWHADRPDNFFNQMADKAGVDILIYGHTHKPYHREIDGRIFINAGSVGKPKDGDSRACAALIEITGDKVDCRFIRAEYDISATVEAILKSGLPPELAGLLKSAK